VYYAAPNSPVVAAAGASTSRIGLVINGIMRCLRRLMIIWEPV